MKYLFIIITIAVIGCGGDLPPNCGDGVLQDDELCELGMQERCDNLVNYTSTVRRVDCVDCHGWDISLCLEDDDE